MNGIALLPLTRASQEVAQFLSLALAEVFSVPCRVLPEEIPLAPYYNGERRQYHSTPILQQLMAVAGRGDTSHVLGVLDVDLYIPILTFVYGEARLGGCCALISTCRLHQAFYGLPEDEVLFLRRSEKEAIHELGHTLGLTHCRDYECVMHYSQSVEYIDLKRSTFCADCHRALGLPRRWW
ncbi:MAG: archaemetzincin family Zn-dependent metalloprotease [Thermodesulfobacteriota bacterium]